MLTYLERSPFISAHARSIRSNCRIRRREDVNGLPTSSHKPLTVRSPSWRSTAFSREKAHSNGLKSGLYGEQKCRIASVASIFFLTATLLWPEGLAIMATSPGYTLGTRNCAT